MLVQEYYCTNHDYSAKLRERPPEIASGQPSFQCPDCNSVYKVVYPDSAAGDVHLAMIHNPDWNGSDATR